MFKTEPLYASSTSTGNPTGKNLNNLLADDDEPQGEPPGLIQQILNFFSKLWSPSTSDAEKLGFSYIYAEDGSLLGEYGSGGSNSTGTAQYIYLPTASGPMPIAAVIKGQTYAVHSDHLNTPRKLTQPDGQVAWQWAYSAFGDEQPTIGANRFTSETTTPTTGATSIPEVTFNLRYPGQYFDAETKLHYNYFRTYAPGTGRYTQGDPIGLDGGWNRFSYVEANPLLYQDPLGMAPGSGDASRPVSPIIIDPTQGAREQLLKRINRWWYECRCEQLEAEISSLAEELRSRYLAMLGDERDLYNTAYLNRLSRRGGSWVGHQQKFKELRDRLRALIETADARGCYVSPWDRALANFGIPPDEPAIK